MALRNGTVASVMEALKEIMDFFDYMGLKITMIRTDNAMMFKKTNFVKCNIFNQFCKDNNIIHQFTPKSQPQCDGCVERFHRIYDDELVEFLKHAKTFEQIQALLRKFLYYYNFKRYHHYGELNFLPKKKQYMKPCDAIAFFNSYNEAC